MAKLFKEGSGETTTEPDDISQADRDAIARWEKRRAERRAAEHGYDIDGMPVQWWREDPPARWWTTQEGVHCAINVAPHQGLNGYVWLPEGHPWRDCEEYEVPCEVHGGITFGPHMSGWIGFDTNHAFDVWDDNMALLPDDTLMSWTDDMYTKLGVPLNLPPSDHDTHWTYGLLVAEVEHLAQQVARAVTA